MIDLDTERVVPLTKAAQHVPTRPHLSTIWRWANRGLNGTRLETVKIGGVTCTSREALNRFFERCTNPDVPVARTSGQRERAADRAERELEDAGV